VAERTRRSRTSTRRKAEEPTGRLNRDYGDEEYREPGEGYQGEQPTKGLYTCKLVSINDHTKQGEDEASSVRWGFELVEGSENKHGDDVSGWRDYIYTTENTLWREQQMLVALGVIKPGGKVNLTYDGIVKKAKACTVRVGTERYVPEDGGDPEWRGRMQAFLPLREGSVSKTKSRRAKDEDAEDVFDEEEGDEDEDEEEAPPARSRRSTSRSRRKAEVVDDDVADEDADEDEDEDEDEDYDPDTLAAELEDLSLAALKKRARDEFGVKITRGMDSEKIIDAVLDTLGDEEEDEEEEPEEEPEPPKRRSRAATGTRRAKRGNNNEPPF
jgi:hypothetical protein